MKKLLFAIGLLLGQLNGWAQTEKGRWNVGVSIGSFSYQSAETGHSFSGSLSPSVGRFIAPNLLLGVGVPLSLTSSKFTYPQNSINNRSVTIGLSPFVRYYLGASALKPYIGTAVGYSYSDYRNETALSVSTNKGTILQVSPSVGLAYFINRTVSVDAQVSYNWASFKSKSTSSSGGGSTTDNPATTYKNASLSLGFNLFFGQ